MKFFKYWAGISAALCVGMAFSAPEAAAVNSWTNQAAAGFWQESNRWSLGVPPLSSQGTIFITNTVSKTVTINSSTPSINRTIKDLTLAAPNGFTNTLQLTNAGTVTPLRIVKNFIITNGGRLLITNSVLSADGVAGGPEDGNSYIDGSVTVLAGGSMTTTNTPDMNDGTLTVVGNASSGSLTVQGGRVLANTLYMGLEPGSRGTFTMSGGETKSSGLMCAGCRTDSTGAVWVAGGQLSVSNDFLIIGGDGRMGQMTVSNGTVTVQDFVLGLGDPDTSVGTLTVAGGTVQTLLDFTAGYNANTTGTVWITGGQFSVGISTILGYQPPSYGEITVSNGAVTTKNLFVGDSTGLSGSLGVYGGNVLVSSNMLIGYCPVSASGTVLVAGGSLFVTNANTNAVLEISGGTLTLSSGLLVADTIVITNTCAYFVYTGGTLLYGTSLLSASLDADGDGMLNGWEIQYGLGPLNPFGDDGASGDPDGDGFTNLEESQLATDPTNSDAPPFHITSIVREGNNIRIGWVTIGGTTNFVQAASSPGGSFADISSAIVIAGAFSSNTVGTVTNYLNSGAITNVSARFYRIRRGGTCVPPSITTQPFNSTNCVGDAASFAVAAGGSGPLNYRWRKNGVNLSDGGNILGATTANLTIVPVGTSDAASYDIVVSNACGSVTSVVASLTVNTAPTISCPANITVPNAPGQCSSNVAFMVGTTGSPAPTVTCTTNGLSVTSGASFPKGTTTVNCTAANLCDSTNCTFSVTVNDTEKPVPSCPGNITVSAAPGQCSSNVSFLASFTDNCAGGSVLCAPVSGSSFAKGTTNVVCTATDASGNSSNCTFSVTVNDTEKPVPSCPGNITVSAAPGQCASNVSFLASFTDNCAGGSVLCAPVSGSTFVPGTNNVTCTATDTSGNSSNCSFSVIVTDTENPTITCPADVVITNAAGVCCATGVVLGAPITGDNCGVASVTSNAPSSFLVGTNSVLWTVTDDHGNTTNCVQQVIVNLTNPNADTDGDGISDLAECLIGSDPLDSASGLRVLNIQRLGTDLKLTWLTVGGSTNVVQLANPIISGNYTNSYISLATLFVPGSGTVTTNWVDVGGATNAPSRYYRIQLSSGTPNCP